MSQGMNQYKLFYLTADLTEQQSIMLNLPWGEM